MSRCWFTSKRKQNSVPVYKLSIAAEQDLIDIYSRGLKNWGEKQADVYLDRLVSAFNTLINNPDLGRTVALQLNVLQECREHYILRVLEASRRNDWIAIYLFHCLPPGLTSAVKALCPYGHPHPSGFSTGIPVKRLTFLLQLKKVSKESSLLPH